MKSKFLVPALTAALGFTLAWVAKPGTPVAPVVVKAEESSPKKADRVTTDGRPTPTNSNRPKEVHASDFPLVDQAEQGPKSRDEARLLRLMEALGLSISQQSDLIQLVGDAQAKINGEVPVIQDLTARGKMIEDGLAKLLSPEQLAKFQEIRARERDNRIEDRSQKMLALAITDIDMSPEQRQEALVRLREKVKADLQSIPASATLLLDNSILAGSKKELSVDGVLLLSKMGEVPENVNDPMAARQKLIESQKRDMEEIYRCFDGILTPGQMGQYQAAISESREILKRMPQNAPEPPTAAPPPAAAPQPDPEGETVTEVIPDDEDDEEDPPAKP